MIRIFIIIIIAAVILPFVYFQFRTIPLARKMIVSGGALAAAVVGVLMQSVFAWYMALLALLAVSLLASLVYMKVLEKEKNEKEREAEERKVRRQEQLAAASVSSSLIEEEPVKEREVIKERESIKVPEKVTMPEPVKMPGLKKEPKPEKEPERIKELVGAKPFGMQSIKPVGKEDQGGQ